MDLLRQLERTLPASCASFFTVSPFSPNPQFEEEELEEGDEEVSVEDARRRCSCLNVSQPPCSLGLQEQDDDGDDGDDDDEGDFDTKVGNDRWWRLVCE